MKLSETGLSKIQNHMSGLFQDIINMKVNIGETFPQSIQMARGNATLRTGTYRIEPSDLNVELVLDGNERVRIYNANTTSQTVVKPLGEVLQSHEVATYQNLECGHYIQVPRGNWYRKKPRGRARWRARRKERKYRLRRRWVDESRWTRIE